MEQDEACFDQLSMIDEEIPLDGCPCHEKDAQLQERVIQDDPAGTSTDGKDRSMKQEGESDRKFDTGDETIDE
jgi:hypothetical protein